MICLTQAGPRPVHSSCTISTGWCLTTGAASYTGMNNCRNSCHGLVSSFLRVTFKTKSLKIDMLTQFIIATLGQKLLTCPKKHCPLRPISLNPMPNVHWSCTRNYLIAAQTAQSNQHNFTYSTTYKQPCLDNPLNTVKPSQA